MTPQLNLQIKGKITLECAASSPAFQSELDASATTEKQWDIQKWVGQRGWRRRVQTVLLSWFTCTCVSWFSSRWQQARRQLVSQLCGLFWSFPIKHDPLPLILFATRSVTVILSATNRLLQHIVKFTPDQDALGSYSITHWKSVNKRCFLYLTSYNFAKERS